MPDATTISPRPPTWRRGPVSGTGPARPPLCGECPAAAHGFVLTDIEHRPQVAAPEQAADVVVPLLYGADRERCVAALLDTKHRLLRTVTVSVGSLDHTFMSPREILRDALLANAAAVVVAHNHPSGDPEPSRDDELLTRRLVQAGEVVGIEILDHLVVGGARWVSLARRGLV